jgi:hypothetical protein
MCMSGQSIDVAYHHIRDLHKRNQIQVDFVPSQDMIADGLTKPLPRQMFERLCVSWDLTTVGANRYGCTEWEC